MKVAIGKVVQGKVVVTDPSIKDGTDVFIVTREHDDEDSLGPEELAELEAGIAETDRGEMVSAEELFRSLRRFG